MRNTLQLLTLFLILSSGTIYGQTSWKPYQQNVSFKIKNAGLSVNGTFDTISTTLFFSPEKLAGSSLSGIVKVNSIHTGIGKRDRDLKKQEYFDLEKFKDIEIKSTKIYYKNNQYAGLFDVTIKGVTKQVEIPFEFDPLANEAEFKGSFTINRRDFGVGGRSMIMGDEATISIDIKAKK